MTVEDRPSKPWAKLLPELGFAVVELGVGVVARTLEEGVRQYADRAQTRAARNGAESVGPTETTVRISNAFARRVCPEAGLIVEKALTGAGNDLATLCRKINGQ